jgi:hypothetical protein
VITGSSTYYSGSASATSAAASTTSDPAATLPRTGVDISEEAAIGAFLLLLGVGAGRTARRRASRR